MTHGKLLDVKEQPKTTPSSDGTRETAARNEPWILNRIYAGSPCFPVFPSRFWTASRNEEERNRCLTRATGLTRVKRFLPERPGRSSLARKLWIKFVTAGIRDGDLAKNTESFSATRSSGLNNLPLWTFSLVFEMIIGKTRIFV